MYTSNNFVFDNICSNINNYNNKQYKYKNYLVKFGLDPSCYVEDLPLFIAACTYETFKYFIKNLNATISLKRCENFYNSTIWSSLYGSQENIKAAASGWVRFVELYNKVIKLIEGADYVYPLINFSKTLYVRDRKTLQSNIDLLYIKNGEAIVLNIAPYSAFGTSLNVISNIDIVLGLDYLFEADLDIAAVYELSIDVDKIDRNVHMRRIRINDKIKSFIKKIVNVNKPIGINRFLCINCPYKNSCTLKEVLK